MLFVVIAFLDFNRLSGPHSGLFMVLLLLFLRGLIRYPREVWVVLAKRRLMATAIQGIIIQAKSFGVLVRHLKVNLILPTFTRLSGVIDVVVCIARGIWLSHRWSVVVWCKLFFLTFGVAKRVWVQHTLAIKALLLDDTKWRVGPAGELVRRAWPRAGKIVAFTHFIKFARSQDICLPWHKVLGVRIARLVNGLFVGQ
jgi:hypothetical protein